MSTTFDRWEKDPFFSAAEEVQESADRMESIYRRWMNERKARSTEDATGGERGEDEDVTGELRRELRTALGTAKWQLEEFDRASKVRDKGLPEDDEAKTRHMQFVSAIGSQVLSVEKSLRESEMEEGRTGLPWVRLDQGERDELAAFLSASPVVEKAAVAPQDEESDGAGDCPGKGPRNFMTPPPSADERVQAHRRTASVGNDIGAWAISLSNEDSPRRSFDDGLHHPQMPKVFSMSRLAGAMESSTSKMKWPKNGFRKWKYADQLHTWESIPLQNHQGSRGLNACYEKSKSCIDSCSDESYNKHLYGWIGAIQRQLQRSQYQIQYARPVQMIFWVVAALMLIVLFVPRAI